MSLTEEETRLFQKYFGDILEEPPIKSNLNVEKVSRKTLSNIRVVENHDFEWLNSKIKTLKEDTEIDNRISILGEIRAYGSLLRSKFNVEGTTEGADFIDSDLGVNIEVHTPNYSGNKTEIEHGSKSSRSVEFHLKEVAPKGFPERREDNVQGEAISKFSSIKEKEQQFDEDKINMLWVDLIDSYVWPLPFKSYEFTALTSFRNEITSGSFWNAFYAKRGTPIFCAAPLDYGVNSPYEMEYPGRFQRDCSVIDFLIGNTLEGKIVFENPQRDHQSCHQVYQNIHSLDFFTLEMSFLNWPENRLNEKIDLELDKIHSYNNLLNQK